MSRIAYLFTIFIFISFHSCVSPKYYVISESDLNSVNWATDLKRYVPILEGEVRDSEALKIVLECCREKKYGQIEKRLEVCSEGNGFYLGKALSALVTNSYVISDKYLDKVDDDYSPQLVQLIKVDIFYERAKKSNGVDVEELIKKYQVLLDKYPDYPHLSKLVQTRMRHIRYNN